MGLTFNQTPRKAGVWLTVSNNGYHTPFAKGLCFNKAHADVTEDRFRAWARQGWPYVPTDTIPAYMVKTSDLLKQRK